MDNHPSLVIHHTNTFPTLSSLLRLLPLSLLFILTTPHNIAEQIHSIYARRPYLKPSLRDPFPYKDGDILLDDIDIRLGVALNQSNIVLQPGTSLYASLRAPNVCSESHPCSAILESWYDSSLLREFKPDPYFLAANHEVPQPFPPHPRHRIADDEAFLIWRPYHYLQIPRVLSHDNWHVRILNHDSTVFNVLNATLRITVNQTSPHSLTDASHVTANGLDEPADISVSVPCPGGPDGHPCSAHGDCSPLGKCACDDGWGGHYCETQIFDLPSGSFKVAADGMLVFRYIAPRNASVTIRLQIVSPSNMSTIARPILFAKRPGANGGTKLSAGPPLPTIYDLAFTDTWAIHRYLPIQNVVVPDVRTGETILIGVYNFHPTAPAWLVRRHRNLRNAGLISRRFRAVHVFVHAYPCCQDGHAQRTTLDTVRKPRSIHLPPCAPRSDQNWNMTVSHILFPILLGFATIMTLFVCASVWAGIFRPHLLDSLLWVSDLPVRFAPPNEPINRRDKLSEVEVNAMFPSFRFTKRETDALCAVGDASCSVCLCSFEEGELLRRLPCGHSYHSACLDRWLLTNASCPRCRKAARILGNIVQSGLTVRRTLRFLISRIIAFWSWLRTSCCAALCGGRRDQVNDFDDDGETLSRSPGNDHDVDSILVNLMQTDQIPDEQV